MRWIILCCSILIVLGVIWYDSDVQSYKSDMLSLRKQDAYTEYYYEQQNDYRMYQVSAIGKPLLLSTVVVVVIVCVISIPVVIYATLYRRITTVVPDDRGLLPIVLTDDQYNQIAAEAIRLYQLKHPVQNNLITTNNELLERLLEDESKSTFEG